MLFPLMVSSALTQTERESFREHVDGSVSLTVTSPRSRHRFDVGLLSPEQQLVVFELADQRSRLLSVRLQAAFDRQYVLDAELLTKHRTGSKLSSEVRLATARVKRREGSVVMLAPSEAERRFEDASAALGEWSRAAKLQLRTLVRSLPAAL